MDRNMRDKIDSLIVGYKHCDDEDVGLTQERKAVVQKELDNYIATSLFNKHARNEEWNRYTDPLVFWTTKGNQFYPKLGVLASRVFHVVASSAATERSFSTNSFIHSPLRNRLSKKKGGNDDVHHDQQQISSTQRS